MANCLLLLILLQQLGRPSRSRPTWLAHFELAPAEAHDVLKLLLLYRFKVWIKRIGHDNRIGFEQDVNFFVENFVHDFEQLLLLVLVSQEKSQRQFAILSADSFAQLRMLRRI